MKEKYTTHKDGRGNGVHRGGFEEDLGEHGAEQGDNTVPDERDIEGGVGGHLLQAVEEDEHGSSGEPSKELVVLVGGNLEVLGNNKVGLRRV